MDFDIGNIFYIILTLVVVIVSVLGKKKKPAPGGTGSPGNSARPGFMENLERVLNMNSEPFRMEEEPFEEDLIVEQVPAQEAAKTNSAMTKRPSLIDEYYHLMNRSKDGEMILSDSDEEEGTGSMEIQDLDDESGPGYFEMIENFDAGKAVVYSTIINRLDY